KEVTGLARTLARTRVVAEQEARLRLSGESIWTEERLKQFVRMRFGDHAIFVVSNREPLSHVRDGKEIRTQQPASGLVTALEPIMLVQDYHFALLPHMIKRLRPDARIALFWHIPWPNSEAFGICPWQEEILLGMLGADLVGFHTQFHCNNFLETVERAIEGRVEWDDFRVVRGQHTTQVQPFPISVAAEPAAAVTQDRASVRARLGLDGALVALGVERVD